MSCIGPARRGGPAALGAQHASQSQLKEVAMRVSRTLKILGLLLVGSLLGGTAFAAKSVITSSDIKDETIQNRDIDKGVITMNRFAQSTQDKINEAATPGPGGGAGSPGPAGRRVRLVRPAPPERRVLPARRGFRDRRAMQRPPSSASPPCSSTDSPKPAPTRFSVLSVPLGRRRAGPPAAVSSGSRALPLRHRARSRSEPRSSPRIQDRWASSRLTIQKEDSPTRRCISASTQTDPREGQPGAEPVRRRGRDGHASEPGGRRNTRLAARASTPARAGL